MNNKTLRRIYKAFAKELLDTDIFIKVGSEFFYTHRDEKISVAKTIASDEFEMLIDNYFSAQGYNYNAYTIGFLHELGHHWSKKAYRLTDEFFYECLLEVEFLRFHSKMIGQPYAETLVDYYQIESERLANSFLEVAHRNKSEVIKKYDRILGQVCT